MISGQSQKKVSVWELESEKEEHRSNFDFPPIGPPPLTQDLSCKLKDVELPKVLLSDSYFDATTKDFGGESFVDGKGVSYDHKYRVREEWIRNKATANERNRLKDRPKSFARRRNDERIIANVARGSPPRCPPDMGDSAPPPPPPPMEQNYEGPPPPNMGVQRPQPNYGGSPPRNNMGRQRPQANYRGAPAQNKIEGAPAQKTRGGAPPQSNRGGAPAQNNLGGASAQNNRGGVPAQNNREEGPPIAGCSRNNNNDQEQSGGTQPPQGQSNYPPKRDGSGNSYQG